MVSAVLALWGRRCRLAIRKEQTLSFEATKDNVSRELLTIEVRPGMCLNRMLVLYGANASRKSNILYAYETVWRMLVSSYTSKLQYGVHRTLTSFSIREVFRCLRLFYYKCFVYNLSEEHRRENVVRKRSSLCF